MVQLTVEPGTIRAGEQAAAQARPKAKVILHHLVVQDGADEDVMAALEAKATTQEKLLNALKVRAEQIRKGA